MAEELEQDNPAPAIIIAGYGVVGRHLAEHLDARGIAYRVVELNASTVARLGSQEPKIMAGDIREERILRAAGIETAEMLAITFPDDPAVLEAIQAARQINPRVRILARCTYTSCGLQAEQLGAESVVVAEQVVARELLRVLEQSLEPKG